MAKFRRSPDNPVLTPELADLIKRGGVRKVAVKQRKPKRQPAAQSCGATSTSSTGALMHTEGNVAHQIDRTYDNIINTCGSVLRRNPGLRYKLEQLRKEVLDQDRWGEFHAIKLTKTARPDAIYHHEQMGYECDRRLHRAAQAFRDLVAKMERYTGNRYVGGSF